LLCQQVKLGFIEALGEFKEAVGIWGKLVGAVAWDEDHALANFEYDHKFKQLISCHKKNTRVENFIYHTYIC